MKNATSRRWVLALWLTLGFVQGSKSWARDVSASRNDPVVRAYELLEGTLTFRFDEDALHALGIGFVPQGAVAADATGNVIIFEVDPSASPRFELSGTGFERLSGGPIVSCGALLLDRPGERMVLGNLSLCAAADGALTISSTLGAPSDDEPFELGATSIEWDRSRRWIHLEGELLVTASWAARLDQPEASGVSIGSVTIEALIEGERAVKAPSTGDCRPIGDDPGADGGVAAAGSDVLVADLQSITRYAPVGDITAYAVGTTACNIGTQRASWVAGTNQHPVIIQNLYRLQDDRFEQIGMSWVKHGFYAVSQDYCGTCTDPTSGTQLGVGCSDPYAASLNGVQTNMSPRSAVNPNTGFFDYPWAGPLPADAVDRRLQVHQRDLDPAQNAGARYFVEGHYVHPDDCAAGTQDNNASYREVRLTNPSPGVYNLGINGSWTTQRGRPAVRAWHDADPSVVETDIRVSGEWGLFILAGKATPLADGYWRYAYALQNLNSDRAARSFSVDLPAGASVENVSFHDVAHHSGEPYLHAPWTVSVTSTGITWFTEPYEVNPNANALRFDTIYGFYFDVNVEPGAAKAEIALFKPGLPDSVTANTVGPKPILTDCNHNDVSDRCDVVDCDAVECDTPCGGSRDCNANQVPDECESDCNGNGVADACDIGNCPPNDWTCADCNQNEAPDECDPDCDADGIIDDCEVVVDEDDDCVEDCADLCPTTTPARACCTPYDRIVVCCFSSGIYIQEVFTWSQCLIVDGVPVCDDPPMCPGTPCPDTMCRDGCLVGDGDDDGDLDLRDLAALQSCYSGGVGQSGYDIPPSQCLTPFDFNEDVDVDRQDYRGFHERCSGPRP